MSGVSAGQGFGDLDEVEIAGHHLPVIMEHMLSYQGESRSKWHFFSQFITFCTWKGSILQFIMAEVLLTACFSALAYLIFHKPDMLGLSEALEPPEPTAHTIIGGVLGFMLVFRTQQAYNFFLEGHVLVNDLTSVLRALAVDVLGAVPAKGLNPDEHQLVLALVRHLKLFYFVVVEHVRSRTSKMDWAAAHAMVIKLASSAELAECELEFGLPNARREGHPVPRDINVIAELLASGYSLEKERPTRPTRPTRAAPRGGGGSTEQTSHESALEAITTLAKQRNAGAENSASFAKKSISRMRQPGATGQPDPYVSIEKDLAQFRGLNETSTHYQRSAENSVAAIGQLAAMARASRRASQIRGIFSRRSSQEDMEDDNSRQTTVGRAGRSSSPVRKISRRSSSESSFLPQSSFSIEDPTLSKAPWVALLLRDDIQLLNAVGLVNVQMLSRTSMRIDGLLRLYASINRVDKMVLPMPYAQLLKIVMLSFVFSVPFVLAPNCHLLTPFVSIVLTVGYVGLDCVALGLECPFGVGDENLPLLSIGSELSKSLDTLLRSKARHIRRFKKECGVGLFDSPAGGKSAVEHHVMDNNAKKHDEVEADDDDAGFDA